MKRITVFFIVILCAFMFACAAPVVKQPVAPAVPMKVYKFDFSKITKFEELRAVVGVLFDDMVKLRIRPEDPRYKPFMPYLKEIPAGGQK